MMKKAIGVLLALTALAALAEGLILLQIHVDAWRLAALLESLSLSSGRLSALATAASCGNCGNGRSGRSG